MTCSRLTLSVLTLFPVFAFAQVSVTAESAVVIDANSGKILFSKNGDVPRFPASTTKIMTGMLLVERCLPSEIITAPPEIETVKESSMHLKPGERVNAHDMLYALMLRSANDGAYAVATHISGSSAKFAQLMNERAVALGCTHTHFDNPNGLNDDQHWTTAHDLALIAREAMKYEPFRQAVHTRKYLIQRSINGKDRTMVSRNKWLWKDVSADGIKTGYTVPAGHCYVGSATRDGYRVITVVMKSEHWQLDHQNMLNWAFKNHQMSVLARQNQPLESPAVAGGAQEKVAIGPVVDVTTLYKKGAANPFTLVQSPGDATFPIQAPVKKGQALGTITVRDADGFDQRVQVVALEDVPLAPLRAAVQGTTRPGSMLFGGALCVGAFLVRGRARKRMKSYARRTAKRRYS